MKVTYLGTGAAEGVPALFCNCAYCAEARRRGGRAIRSRAHVLFDGELSVDFPPDAFYHAVRFGVDLSAVRFLFVTHSHMDHFNAHDLILRGYKYAHGMTSPALDLYCNREVEEIFREETRREMKPSVAEGIRVHPLEPFRPVRAGEWTVHPLPARHTSREPLLFLLEKGGKCVLHLTDTGALPEETVRYLEETGKRADLVTLDCTFLFGETAEGARHMGLDENVRTLGRLSAAGAVGKETKRVITHFSHNSAPSEERLAEAERRFGVIAAYDGMEIEI